MSRDYYAADQDVGRLNIRRVESVKIRDDDEMQYATADGYDDEQFDEAHRAQNFGLTSHPPNGSHGLVVSGNGRPDQGVVVGMEHPQYRPRNLPEGATKLYDKDGTFVYLDAGGNLFAETRKKAEVKAGEEAKIEAPTIRLIGNIIITGNITQTGGISSTGVHQAAGHT